MVNASQDDQEHNQWKKATTSAFSFQLGSCVIFGQLFYIFLFYWLPSDASDTEKYFLWLAMYSSRVCYISNRQYICSRRYHVCTNSHEGKQLFWTDITKVSQDRTTSLEKATTWQQLKNWILLRNCPSILSNQTWGHIRSDTPLEINITIIWEHHLLNSSGRNVTKRPRYGKSKINFCILTEY